MKLCWKGRDLQVQAKSYKGKIRITFTSLMLLQLVRQVTPPHHSQIRSQILPCLVQTVQDILSLVDQATVAGAFPDESM